MNVSISSCTQYVTSSTLKETGMHRQIE